MYESFYGLKEKPFDLHPDPDYLYMSSVHDDVWTHLQYAIGQNKGFVVITGEIGSGKTTLINYLLKAIDRKVNVGVVYNTAVPPEQFLRIICQEFELRVNGLDKPDCLDLFNRYLLQQYSARNRVVLIVDEAQNLPTKTLEEVRMLSNVESDKDHLLQIILAGQPNLREKLRDRRLEQLTQRVAVHCHLSPLDLKETCSYIRHRLEVAGAKDLEIFDDEAIEAVHTHSRGIPRLINILCDTALVYGFGDNLRTIGRVVIEAVVEAREVGGLFGGAGNGEKDVGQKDAVAAERMESLENQVRLLHHKMDILYERFCGTKYREGLLLELFRTIRPHIDERLREIGQRLTEEQQKKLSGTHVIPRSRSEKKSTNKM
jgi:general secretion pathway protein A